ncbi:MAG: hypothetical protein HQM03_17490 [Magnetococcales bacterium]|nr:hypothetical protein [Magnetococcales bacterium]
MRELRTPGFVRGVPGDGHSYRVRPRSALIIVPPTLSTFIMLDGLPPIRQFQLGTQLVLVYSWQWHSLPHEGDEMKNFSFYPIA